MRRTIIRCIITVVLGCLCVAPLAAHTQPPTHVHRIGVLSGSTREQNPVLEAFLEGMRALGYVEGQNLVMEYRGAEGQYERFPALAAELVRLKVDVIVTGTTPGALAAKEATQTIPIVMVGGGNVVGDGFVASLARPGGNITGVVISETGLAPKRLQLLPAAPEGSGAARHADCHARARPGRL